MFFSGIYTLTPNYLLFLLCYSKRFQETLTLKVCIKSLYSIYYSFALRQKYQVQNTELELTFLQGLFSILSSLFAYRKTSLWVMTYFKTSCSLESSILCYRTKFFPH